MGHTHVRTLGSSAIPSPAVEAPRETPDIETSSDDYARRFSGAAGRYFLDVQARGVGRLMRNLASKSVLDVGGGHGQLVAVFRSHDCRLTVFGSDESTHQRLRAGFPDGEIEFATGDLTELPYADRCFDLVTAVRLISHIEAWQKLVAELCRVARHSVIIDYPSWRSLNALTPLLFRFKRSIEGDTRLYTSFLPSRLAAEFGRHGFEVSESYSQFLLPMLLHRALRGAGCLQKAESVFRRVGMTALFGSPILLRADRVALPEGHRAIDQQKADAECRA